MGLLLTFSYEVGSYQKMQVTEDMDWNAHHTLYSCLPPGHYPTSHYPSANSLYHSITHLQSHRSMNWIFLQSVSQNATLLCGVVGFWYWVWLRRMLLRENGSSYCSYSLLMSFHTEKYWKLKPMGEEAENKWLKKNNFFSLWTFSFLFPLCSLFFLFLHFIISSFLFFLFFSFLNACWKVSHRNLTLIPIPRDEVQINPWIIHSFYLPASPLSQTLHDQLLSPSLALTCFPVIFVL